MECYPYSLVNWRPCVNPNYWNSALRRDQPFSYKAGFQKYRARMNRALVIQFPEGRYPLTFTFANESTAFPVVGLPNAVAGRNWVKISILFSSGTISFVFSGAERIL